MYKFIYSVGETVVFYGVIFIILVVSATVCEEIKNYKCKKEEKKSKEKNKTINTMTSKEIEKNENITEEKGKIDKKDVEEATEYFLKYAIYKNFCIELREYILKGKIERKIIDDEEEDESFFDINIFFDNRCDDITRIKRFLIKKEILKSVEEIKRYEKYIFYTTENLYITLEIVYIENKKMEKIKIFLEENNISFEELYYSKLNKKIYF